MFLVKKEDILKDNFSFASTLRCSFCKNKLCSNRKDKINKCISFYKRIISLNVKGFYTCPYGFDVFVYDSNFDFFVAQLLTEKTDDKHIKKIVDNSKKVFQQLEHFEREQVILAFENYNTYIEVFNSCIQLQHDLGNAIQYFYSIVDSAAEAAKKKGIEQVLGELLKGYEKIAADISPLEQISMEPFSFSGKWNEVYSSALDQLVKIITDVRHYSNKSGMFRNEFDCRKNDEHDLFCAINGFKLLDNILMKDLALISYFKEKSNKEISNFRPYDIMVKMVNLLQYKADQNDVVFADFEGRSTNKIKNNNSITVAIFTLLDNAIKYCSTDNKIIEIKFQDLGTDKVHITISNSSDYLSKEDLQRITEKGYRGTNKTKKGNGLGLYLVKEIFDESNCSILFDYKDGRFISKLTLNSAPKS